MARLEYPSRPSQQQVLRYTGGRLGVSAVPGAGKTHLLSALAAKIIAEGRLRPGQELLVVTLVNAAVDNFKNRIAGFLEEPALALYSYRVRTLHGLAHDIVRENPGQVGLEVPFAIADERESQLIRSEAVQAWLSNHPGGLDSYIVRDLGADAPRRVRSRDMATLLDEISMAFIRTAKDHRLTPADLNSLSAHAPAPLPLAEICTEIYADYQRALAYRGAVDFDDLIRLALDLLETDEGLRSRLRARYPYILEDEAQDSSISQERILRLLAGDEGNWVRVGDPNQAIYETFTTASPELLRAFVREHPSQEIPESGRSQPAIIRLANYLVDWASQQHPLAEARTALGGPRIATVPEGDPQPNPAEAGSGISLIPKNYTPDGEIRAVVASLATWLPANPDRTVAVLVPRNTRGAEVISALQARGIEAIELLGSTSQTRHAVGTLMAVLSYIAEPGSGPRLAAAYAAWRSSTELSPGPQRAQNGSEGTEPDLVARPDVNEVRRVLRRISNPEAVVAPADQPPVLSSSSLVGEEGVHHELVSFRPILRTWLDAAVLPIDQLVLTLGQELFREPADLALSHRLALVLRRAMDDHRGWRLPEIIEELAQLASHERRFLGFSSQDSGFDPARHAGKVVVTTMHKAKGLEWDRVYLTSVNDYDFPSGQEGDVYQSEKYFIRGQLSLQAEALAQLSCLHPKDAHTSYEEGRATLEARIDYVRERLRLLFVGITRAKRELIVTWNTGRRGTSGQALAFQAVQRWWQAGGDKPAPAGDSLQPQA